jgi:hypothetical protein
MQGGMHSTLEARKIVQRTHILAIYADRAGQAHMCSMLGKAGIMQAKRSMYTHDAQVENTQRTCMHARESHGQT